MNSILVKYLLSINQVYLFIRFYIKPMFTVDSQCGIDYSQANCIAKTKAIIHNHTRAHCAWYNNMPNEIVKFKACANICGPSRLTVASLQTPHLTTCWWILPSTLISDWHTLQLMTGALPLSGDVRGEYGGGFSPNSTGGWVELGNGGKPKNIEGVIPMHQQHVGCMFYVSQIFNSTIWPSNRIATFVTYEVQ